MHFYIVSLNLFLNANWNQDDRIKKKKGGSSFPVYFTCVADQRKTKKFILLVLWPVSKWSDVAVFDF